MGQPAELFLYGFDSCPWCARVRSAIADLELNVEELDIHANAEHRETLQATLGQSTVPVLRIGSGQGVQWLPESADIVHYLYETYGSGSKPTFFASRLPQQLGMGIGLSLLVAAFFVTKNASAWFVAAAAFCWLLGNRAPLLWKWFR